MSDGAGAVTWAEVQRGAVTKLVTAGIDGADLEARRLIEAATGADGADYVLELLENVTSKRLGAFDAMLTRRLAGEPLQYVIGSWAFRTLDLAINANVLIPRPETEHVVELALFELSKMEQDLTQNLIAVDLGTGSGAIGLSVAVEHDAVDVWLTDASPEALLVARGNLAGIGSVAATRVQISLGSWFEALPEEIVGSVNLIVSNPPYVRTGERLPASVAEWEPPSALFGGSDGLDDIRQIIAGSPRWLIPGGCIVVELAPDQATAVTQLAAEAGFREARVLPDQYGKLRVLVARI